MTSEITGKRIILKLLAPTSDTCEITVDGSPIVLSGGDLVVDLLNLKEELTELALQTVGQHLWVVRMADPEAKVCLCALCDTARKSYQLATGYPMTTYKEVEAMVKWGRALPQ